MRYFLISYRYNEGFGNFLVEANKFPSIKELKESLKDRRIETKDSLIIQNIFEFRNKKDYENFIIED